ncbi:MAG: pyrimidine dimer DNA glycosylase/endonuclease V [Chloroflexota bacterium]|nr:pyrimidine dimer DNA glycosylase/endonuclease V [Chloroflexota bacterium]
MRIWDVPPAVLCRQHLLGEHRELHGLWRILTLDKKGYAKHPETMRWRGKQRALFPRHAALAVERERRGYRHASPLDPLLATGAAVQTNYVDSPERQIVLLRGKGCACSVAEMASAERTPPTGSEPA